ncbi:Crp/Fnr family transcriptional regulator [Rhizohabitans arisaemae]|uniref:Crp/Fnr family transcriptional regulator n=1 Tax=Rhizohabitans arisaemae TaxID=2720610 RepID=UPI0024B19881|nr:Crp/Fnr family transcriptional regulator [Rhizohabitans arisaemae]
MTVPEPEGFLAQLTPDELADLHRLGRRRRWERGETLIREGDAADSVLILTEGRVKVCSLTESGVEVILAIRGPGSLLGEFSAIDGEPRSADVAALEPASGLVVPVAAFAGYLQNRGRVTLLLLRLVVARMRDADRKRIEFGATDATGRVATRLVELAERFGERVPAGLRISLPISQDELAGWVGASREAVSKALRSLRDRGLIETGRRRVIIRDLDRLRSRAR